jgi:hypothetical protein
MFDKDKSYMILTRVAVPVEMMPDLAKYGFSVDYDYEDGEYRYLPKGALNDVTLISGEQLLANQLAKRMEKGK